MGARLGYLSRDPRVPSYASGRETNLTVISEYNAVVVVYGLELVAIGSTDAPVDVAGGIASWGATFQDQVTTHCWPMNLRVRHRRKRVKNCTQRCTQAKSIIIIKPNSSRRLTVYLEK